MFKTIEPLEHAKHKDLRLAKIPSFNFAKETSTVKLSFSEMSQASRFFPIVFLANAPGLPQALLCLEVGKNVFINDTGMWTTPYVPAFFRLYPFTLAKLQAEQDQYALCLDPEAEHFRPGMGDPLFTADGEPVEFIKNTVLKNLETYQKELEITQALFNVLEDKGVIADQELTLNINGQEQKVAGFRGVNLEKLNSLDDKDLAAMVRNGTMGMVQEQVNSMANIAKLIASPGAAAV